MSYKYLFAFLMILGMTEIVQAQKLNVHFYDNTSSSFEVKDVRSLTFSADSLNVTTNDGVMHSWPFNFINYYNYSKKATSNSTSDLEEKNSNLLIYPNPSKGILNLNFDNINAQKGKAYEVIVYDQTGKIVVRKSYVSDNANEEKRQLNLNTLTNGNYVCEVRMDHYTIRQSFILNK